jgi:hypothetical protein
LPPEVPLDTRRADPAAVDGRDSEQRSVVGGAAAAIERALLCRELDLRVVAHRRTPGSSRSAGGGTAWSIRRRLSGAEARRGYDRGQPRRPRCSEATSAPQDPASTTSCSARRDFGAGPRKDDGRVTLASIRRGCNARFPVIPEPATSSRDRVRRYQQCRVEHEGPRRAWLHSVVRRSGGWNPDLSLLKPVWHINVRLFIGSAPLRGATTELVASRSESEAGCCAPEPPAASWAPQWGL